MKDYDACIAAVDTFLPYVDNWAVCDIMSPKIFKKHKIECDPNQEISKRIAMKNDFEFFGESDGCSVFKRKQVNKI